MMYCGVLESKVISTTALSRWSWVMPLVHNPSAFWLKLALILLCQLSHTALGATAKFNYLLHCAGCHLLDGSGVEPEVPSLRNKLGPLTKTAVGRGYLVQVPGASQVPLTDQDLRDVVNWVLTEYNAKTLPESFTPLTTEEVSKYRKNPLMDPLQYRKKFWPDENTKINY